MISGKRAKLLLVAILSSTLHAQCYTELAQAQSTGVPCLYEDILSVVPLDANLYRLRIDQDVAYTLVYNEGIRIYDYTNSSNPKLLSSMRIVGNGTRSLPVDIELDGSTLYVLESNYGLHAIDVSDPAKPTSLFALPIEGFMDDVDIHDNTAYVTSIFPDRFYTIDISDPTSMSTVGMLDVGCRTVCVSGSTAYLAASGLGVHIVDISDAATPSLITTIDFPVSISEVAIDGTTLLAVGNSTERSFTVDVSDPSNPQVVSEFDDYDFASSIIFKEGLAYAIGRPSIQVLDFSDPSSPELLGIFDTLYDAGDIVIRDGIANITTTSGALLYRISVDSIRDPALLSRIERSGGLNDIHTLGDYAYVADGHNGFVVLDITDPLNPLEITSVTTASPAQSLYIDSGYAYVVLDDSDLLIINIADPASPVTISSTDIDVGIYDICTVGDTAVFTAPHGLYVLDISDKK
ncbi:MAG: hypothetical protein F6K11_22675, partial [Leptolyngbya sp. SIO3F4]|nr:hypothetical protein [Leptolyngbya sp. SIO3F4]